MKIQTSQFYSELISLVQSHIKITEELKSKTETKLNQKFLLTAGAHWNVLNT